MKKLFWLLALVSTSIWGTAQSTKSFDELIQSATAYEGFFDFYYLENKGTVLLLIEDFEQEFLYVNALAAGVGSNDLGLDRGQLDRSRVVKFMRSGPKVMLIQPNYDYRAISDNPAERKAVEEAFAQSVLWGFKVQAEKDGKVLIDITNFLLQDSHRIAQKLKRSKQGAYKLDKSRSALYLPMIKNFPKNSEFEALLTFTGQPQGGYIRSVTPSAEAVTVRTHHSFIELPDDQYQPRVWDPRGGFFSVDFMDYATPIDQNIQKRWTVRHRLNKKDPTAERSEAVEPIVYYVDRGAPEPIKSALIEGAQWWNQAFDAAGFIDAFQVREMPEGADPLDVRYNVIQWVHRSTRGWSYGNTVTDPRTGEIIKGHVSLGSLRVRQDYLIAQGLLSPFGDGQTDDPRMLEMALARLRQLSAHEVGHTIGLAHNFSASTNGRASVMDYPHPYITVNKDNTLNFEEAYDVGIGEWDKVAVQWGYSDLADLSPEKGGGENEQETLNTILAKAYENGLRFLSDQDARSPGSASPYAHLWDNGEDPIADLERISRVRQIGLQNFGMNSIPEGTPLSELERVLVPLYLSHRYQLEAVSKLIGGLDYEYSIKGDQRKLPQRVAPKKEREAVAALLKTLEPSFLELPTEIQALMGAPSLYSGRGREFFSSQMPPEFDWLGAAETAAQMSLRFLLYPHRLNRITNHHALDQAHFSLETYLQLIERGIATSPAQSGSQQMIRLAVEKGFYLELIRSLKNPQLNRQSKAVLLFTLEGWNKTLKGQIAKEKDKSKAAHYAMIHSEINTYLKDPTEYKSPSRGKTPDGSPIGIGCFHDHH
ncbi:MAG: zinc-dependent metalloprotease [Bacteroidota bacterium]